MNSEDLAKRYFIRHNAPTTLVGGNPVFHFPVGEKVEIDVGVGVGKEREAANRKLAQSIVDDFNNVSVTAKMEIVVVNESGDEES